jgi:RNA polymerase sigma-70 factor (ECF subfamily)
MAQWVAAEILPHEGAARRWLTSRWRNSIDVDEVIQETYCRIASLSSIDQIRNGRAYFFRTANTVAIDTMRHARVANAVPVKENDWLNVLDDEPLADRVVEANQELERVNSLLSKLSWTCRRVIELRRLEGLSQKETARQLGVSESVVENHIVRGIRSVLKAMAEQDDRAPEEKGGPIG